jgi:penicillin-binding protein 1C
MQDTTRLFSPEASFIISEILTELQRPDFPSSWEFSPNIPKVAWKTGTSFGRKDAWSIGYNPEYTIGVWTGNFSGRPSPDLVGADVAAPILFDIFETVGAPNARNWFERPQGVGTRDVCALSGMIPNEHCPEKISEIFIPGVSPSGFCDVHRRIEIDTESGYRLCRHCAGGRKSEEMTVEAWPPKIATYLAASGKMVTPIPIHDPDCQGMPRDNRPVITSPGADAIYVIRPHIPMKLQQIAFEASGASGTKQVYWFLDGELFCRAEPGEEVFYAPSPGDHKLICTDDAGRSASIEFRVE